MSCFSPQSHRFLILRVRERGKANTWRFLQKHHIYVIFMHERRQARLQVKSCCCLWRKPTKCQNLSAFSHPAPNARWKCHLCLLLIFTTVAVRSRTFSISSTGGHWLSVQTELVPSISSIPSEHKTNHSLGSHIFTRDS